MDKKKSTFPIARYHTLVENLTGSSTPCRQIIKIKVIDHEHRE
jgi:hypothetical protein